MDMRDIQIFRAVMRAGTTSKAAVLLNISQPAVSQAIRRLESDADLRLFDRVRNRLVPTQEADALLIEVDRCFAGFEQIEHRIRSLKSFGVGRMAVGALPALGAGFMPRAIAAFNPTSRRVQMSFQIMSSREVLQQVGAGQLDFGLMADEIAVVGLEHSPFIEIPGVIAMTPEHPLAQCATVSPEAIVQHDFIVLNPEDASRRRLEGMLADRGLALRPVLETPYAFSVCELVLRGMGIGLIHPMTAVDYLPRGLVIKRLDIDVAFRSLLVFRPGKPLSQNARDLLSIMRIQAERDLAVIKQALR
ncbi:LysR family transcriptional regulator [Bordetella genomosp. 7]|uniref:LysR family transcriptional regulator n=2 Tax=Bordetella TaxID=517 RepID=A0A261RHR4_9BORD|nr:MULTISPECIES: LysR substrate-binding domain-containing protein [Bordetella]OZI24471.1 LysR family transcriptional regulator [Bordetella genomosp. 7]OZI28513.1 LysR family transcriptional regulator [Bordetella genomosp. 7]